MIYLLILKLILFFSFFKEIESVTASAYAQEIGAMYLETSAKDDLNVHDIFVQLSMTFPLTLPFVYSSYLRQANDSHLLLR
jgi:hypothetical protein